MTSFTAHDKPKRSIASLQIERRYRNVITLFLSGQLPNFTHERHVHVANILKHLPYGRELMHLGLQTMGLPPLRPGQVQRRDHRPLLGPTRRDAPRPDPLRRPPGWGRWSGACRGGRGSGAHPLASLVSWRHR